jgi:hypothetical protein
MFDAGSNYLEEKPSVDAEAFQDLKDASEAGSAGTIQLVGLNQASEAESSEAMTPIRVVVSTQATETEIAQAIGIGSVTPQTIELGQVTETETALAAVLQTVGPGPVYNFQIRLPVFDYQATGYRTEWTVERPDHEFAVPP